MHGASVAVLNVGAGDLKLSFDKSNPAERIRAARVVKDMLRRGFALLIESPPGSGTYTRAIEFDDQACEYIIADFDPSANERTEQHAGQQEAPVEPAAGAGAAPATPQRDRGKSTKKRVAADGAKAVAVARTAGG